MIKRLKILSFGVLLVGGAINMTAQVSNDSTSLIEPGVMYTEPLFQYPTAPEDIKEFSAKCDWLAENFWNPFNIKATSAVDQGKLNDAFQVYATTIQYANKDKVNLAIDKLMKTLQKNPMLLYQFTKAAEENIYGPRADIWIDELYARILTSALTNKKFPKTKRARYELQLKQLNGTMVGKRPAEFEFVRANGEPAKYFPMATPTIIIFGDPECDDCRMGKLRMQSNVTFSKAVADGKLNILFIIPDPEDGWKSKVGDFPKNWSVGASDTVADIYDMREVPDVYVVGSDGNIVEKHVSVMKAMQTALSLIE